jgi:hypothetical protein
MARRQKIRQQISDFFNSIKKSNIDWEESEEWEKLSEIERRVISAIAPILNWLISVIAPILDCVISAIAPILDWLINSLKFLSCYLWQRKLLSFVLCLLLIFGSLTLAAFLPSEHFFEGDLIVEEMSFTYVGEDQKLFLDTIRKIKSLNIEGKQIISFTGKFQSQSMPELNQLETLNIDLKDDKSILLIESSESEIELKELRLQANTKIAEMSYDTNRNQLAFSLSNTKQTNANVLKFTLGDQPITISLEGSYQLRNKSGLVIASGKQNQLEFNVTPTYQELMLNLANPVSITLETPKLKNNEAKQWFRGKLEVKEVQFQKLDKTGSSLNDDLKISTILDGKIRMAEQEREIKENQFLMAGEPGIELIRYLNIIPEKDSSEKDIYEKEGLKFRINIIPEKDSSEKKGLEVRISGKSKLIEIGLDEKFPVSRIQASWLDGIFPRDAIIALISFCAASFSYLLYFIIDYIAKSNAKP